VSVVVDTLRVLLVDDDAEQRSLVRRLLAATGISNVDEAGDGASALAVAGDHTYDLILLDLVMPGRSGIELLPDLQERAPTARIVVLSNLPRRMLDEIVRQRGAVGFVEKRVPPAELVPEILTAAALTDVATEHMSLRLGGTTGAAGDARRFVRTQLAVDDEVLSAIELLVSELVTNAVLHASTAPRLAIRLTRSTVRVEVYDDDPKIPEPLPLDSERIGGRGLYIVDAMAQRWGAEPSGDGKVVWFELARSS
jgi:CheY-like chemotaxis protein/anti-sigma regulatory factor (Ser/Thr protein kinase)